MFELHCCRRRRRAPRRRCGAPASARRALAAAPCRRLRARRAASSGAATPRPYRDVRGRPAIARGAGGGALRLLHRVGEGCAARNWRRMTASRPRTTMNQPPSTMQHVRRHGAPRRRDAHAARRHARSGRRRRRRRPPRTRPSARWAAGAHCARLPRVVRPAARRRRASGSYMASVQRVTGRRLQPQHARCAPTR